MTKPLNTTNIKKEMGRRIRALRKIRGMSQQNMADLCDLHWTYIGGLERGERNPTLTTLKRVADGLKVGLHRLVINADKEGPEPSSRDKKEGNILKWLKKGDDPTLELATRMVRELSHWQERYGSRN